MTQQNNGSAPVIPEGWRLVPMEPTNAMHQAGAETLDGDGGPADVWEEMLNASPDAPIRTEVEVRAEVSADFDKQIALLEANAREHLAGWEKFCSDIGATADSYSGVAYHVIKARAAARREALEEAAKAAETCDSPFNCPTDEQYSTVEIMAAILMAGRITAAIRALIEKERA